MRFAVLGPLAVLQDDHEPTIVPGAKERLLLAVLTAAAPGAVSTDRLLETVWDGDPPLTARKSLQAHMVRLRSALEPDRPKGSSGRYVVRRGPGYALSVERVAIDALLFGDLTTRGRARLASGDAAGALKQLTEAVGLWRGEPYADWPDAPFADVERRRLAEVRSATIEGLLEARLSLGQHAEVVPELERLVAEEPLRETWWGLLMLALYRGGRQGDALVAGRRARALLADELGADPGPGLRAVETAILTHDPSLDLPQQRTVEPTAPSDPGTRARPGETRVGGCPYKGLAAYQPADAALFHGRQRLVSALVSRLVDAPLLVVSGPSGAGKSSVVRAGLVPSLAGGALPGSHTWRPLIVSPGPRPVDAIATLTGESPPEATVLLVCDQFEQLWAPGTDEAERGAFLDTVLGLLDDGVVVRCVAVVRGDHLGRLAEHAEWTERIGGAIVLVPPMTDPELRDVVIQPARAAGLDVEPELLDVVVADVLGQVGALPLLSTALVSTWERRRDDRLTVAGYLAAGGVEGALTRTAEAAYAALDDRGRDVAHQLMVRLADAEEGAVLVRRAVPLTELHLHGELGSARRAVVEAFVARRLLAVDDERVEVAHEALLTTWPRLARWLDDDAAGRAVRRHVAPAALQWDRDGRPADELYRGARLAPALDWAAAPGSDPTPLERDFLEASRAQADAELHAARERAEREAAGRRRTRRLAAGLATLLVVALVATGLAVAFQRRADHRATEADAATTVADANRLAALSTTAGSLDVSMLLAAEAARLAETPETQDGLLAALARQPHAIRSVSVRGRGFVAGLAGAGRVLFVAAGDRVVAWDVASGESPRTALRPPARETANWEAFDASPTEALVVIAGNDRVAGRVDVDPWVRVNAADGSRRLWLENGELQGTLVETAFSADGRRLLVLLSEPSSRGGRGWDWSVQEVDLADGAVRATGVEGRFPGSDGPVDGLFADDTSAVTVWPEGSPVGAATIDLGAGRQGKATPLVLDRRTAPFTHFLPLPTGTAQLWEDGAVTLYDHRGRAVQVLDAHEEPVGDVLVSPGGAWAATVGDGGRVVLWDIDPSTGRWSKSEELVGHHGDVTNVEVDPSGQTLFTLSWDATVIAWDVSRDAGFGSSYPALAGRWVSNRPQTVEPGRLLVAPTRPNSRSGADNRVPAPDTSSVAATFLDPATGRTVDQVVVGDTLEGIQFGSSVAVSPDRRMVAVTSGLATTVLDTRTREVLGTVVLPPKGSLGFDGKPLAAEPVWCAGWTPDGSRLLIGAEGLVTVNGDVRDAGIVVVDPATWEVERRVDLGAAPQAIETSPNGRLMAVAMNAAEVQILDAGTLKHLRTVPLGAEDDFPFDLSFSPDGRRLAFGGSLRRLHILDTTTWRPVHEPVEVHDGDLTQVEWMRDGRTVVTSGFDGTVSLFDVLRGLVRAVPLPSSSEPGNGRTYLIADIPGELIAIRGDLTGRRYPMRPSRWLAETCAVAGRDFTRAEWNRYLPDRAYRRTCTPLF